LHYDILKSLYLGVIVIDQLDGKIVYSYGSAPFENFAVQDLTQFEDFIAKNYAENRFPIFDRFMIANQAYWIIRKQKNAHIYYLIQECKQWDKIIEETKAGSHLDGLTKCYTKVEIESFVTNSLATYLRYKENPFSLLMYDIDWFKKVNDVYGHLAGDFVLSELSSLVKTLLRNSDICGRFGGEEFIVILPQTKVAGAIKLAEKIRETTKNHTFTFQGKDIDISISIGVTSVGVKDAPFDLIDRCDKALYDAKEKGRNRVEYR